MNGKKVSLTMRACFSLRLCLRVWRVLLCLIDCDREWFCDCAKDATYNRISRHKGRTGSPNTRDTCVCSYLLSARCRFFSSPRLPACCLAVCGLTGPRVVVRVARYRSSSSRGGPIGSSTSGVRHEHTQRREHAQEKVGRHTTLERAGSSRMRREWPPRGSF